MHARQYKTGSRWAFWRWSDDIGHLVRLFLGQGAMVLGLLALDALRGQVVQ